MDQPSLVPARRHHHQAPSRAPCGSASRASLAHSDLVASAPAARRLSSRSATAQVLRRGAARAPGGALPARRAGATSRRLAAWDQALTRTVLGHDLQRGGPLVERASLLLSRGRRTGTKESYAGKWHHFVVFCTETLPDVYDWKPRCPLPATERTVILYFSHPNMEGLGKERSLNSYLAAINQAHEEVRLPRPALGQGLRLTRAGLRDVEGEEDDSWIARLYDAYWAQNRL